MAAPTHGERLAALETAVPAMQSDITEIKGDVKTLLESYNRQRGAARIMALIWGGLLTLGGAIGGIWVGGKH